MATLNITQEENNIIIDSYTDGMHPLTVKYLELKG